jgi:hypothetical protein
MTFLKTKNNRHILIESIVVSFFALLAFISRQNKYLFFIGIFDIVFLWSIIARLFLFEKKITIVEIFLVFFSLYILGSYFIFNTLLFSLIEDVFFIKTPSLTMYELCILNMYFFLYTKILFIILLDTINKKIKTISINNLCQFNKIYYIPLCIYSIFLIFIKIKYGNYFAFIEDSPDFMYSLISYGGIICSPIIISSNINYPWYKKKFFIVITIVPIVTLALIGIRIYSLLIIFSVILNMQLRGLKLYSKTIVLLLLLLLGFVLFQSVIRAGLNSIGDMYSLATLLGEFFLPAISSYYLIIDPGQFYPHINIIDFIISILPSKLIPYISLNDFAGFYFRKGILTWPVGGIFLYGQLYFYFGKFSVFVMILLSTYLLRTKNKLNSKNIDFSVICLPLLFIILPRYPLYLIKSVFVGLVLFLFLKFLIVKVSL